MERASQSAVRPWQALTHRDLPTTYPAHDNRGRSLRQHRLGRRRVMSVLPNFCRHKRPSLPLPGALWKPPTRAPASQHPDGKRQKVTENRQQQSLRGGGARLPACMCVCPWCSPACPPARARAAEAARGRLPTLPLPRCHPHPVSPPDGNPSPASQSTRTGVVGGSCSCMLDRHLVSISQLSERVSAARVSVPSVL